MKTSRLAPAAAATSLAAAVTMAAFPVSADTDGTTTRVSVATGGAQITGGGNSQVTSTDGRYVAFNVWADGVVPQDTNQTWDVYLRDRFTGVTELVTVGSSGTAAGGMVDDVSADGRYVVFRSSRPDYAMGDDNGVEDVFVRDRVAGITERVSVDSSEAQSKHKSYDGAISNDGRYVVFTTFGRLQQSDTDSYSQDVYLRDRVAGTTELVSVGRDGHQAGGQLADLSGTGRWVSFTSKGKRIVKNDTNKRHDVFVRDLRKDKSMRVSVASDGDQANARSFTSSISGSGKWIAFSSEAKNLVKKDTNGEQDVFLHNRKSGETTIASVNTRGKQSRGMSTEPRISANGRFVTFNASPDFRGGAGGTSGLYLRNRVERTTELLFSNVTPGSAVSRTGHAIFFTSYSDDFVPGDTNHSFDVFAYDW